MKPNSRSATALSAISVAGAATASVTILAWRGAFPEPLLAPVFNGALAEARGWSAVTLAVVLPLFAISLAAARHGSLRGRLAWLGALAYLVYTYLELAVSPPFTALYLVYIATFASALAALVMGVFSIDVEELAWAVGPRMPRRTIAGFGLASGVLLSLAWLKDILARTIAGNFGWPGGEAAIGHVVQALDLGLQVPLGLAAGLLLARRRQAGTIVAAIMLVNALCMGTALTAMVVASALGSGRSVLPAAPFALVPLVALVLAILFFRAIRPIGNVHRHLSIHARPRGRRLHTGEPLVRWNLWSQ